MDGLVNKASLSPYMNRVVLGEYLLVAQPDERVQLRIREESQSLDLRYQPKIASAFDTCIPIASFNASEEMEGTLTRWLERICKLETSFEVTLNNYSGYPPGLIYLRIFDHQPFHNSIARLDPINEYVRSNGLPAIKRYHRPYLPVLLLPDLVAYDDCLPAYAQREFHESFLLTRILLLKRPNRFEEVFRVNVFNLYPPDTNINGYVA